jgi:hypothetical protein
MTQKEAIIKALEKLGGRAQLKDIYPLAIEIGDFSRSQNMKATIRNCLLTNPKDFRHSDGKPDGWWELTSFQEEIAEMKAEIQTLKEENERLRAVPTEDDFVDRFVMQVKTFLKRDTDTVDEIRKILVALNRSDAAKNLDSWIDEHNTPLVSIDKAQDVIASGGKKIVNNR